MNQHPSLLRAGWRTLKRWLRHTADFLFSGPRQRWVMGFFLLLTIAVIVSVIAGNWDLIRAYPWQIRPFWLLYAMIFLLLDMFLGAWVWHTLCARLADFDNLPQNIKIWWYANLAKRIPGAVWYIANRALLYEQAQVSKLTISLLSGLELALIFVSGVITTLLTLPFWALPPALTDNVSQAWLLLLTALLCVALMHPNLLTALWGRLNRRVPPRRLRWRDTLSWLLAYVLVWSVGGLVLFAVVNFLRPLPFSHLPAAIGMWALASTLSLAGALTFTSMGVREISLTLLLTQFMPFPVALIVTICTRVIWLIGEFITALISLKL